MAASYPRPSGSSGLFTVCRARYRNDTWGEMRTFWRFQVTGDKISRIDTGQARALT